MPAEDLADSIKMPGVKSCPICKGVGVLDEPPDAYGIPCVRPCDCRVIKDVALNVERGWKGLFKADRVQASKLKGLEKKNVWVTADRDTFRAHLRHTAVRNGPNWFFRVFSDADLMTSWLGSTALKRIEIGDPDIAKTSGVSMRHHSLVDMIDPPDLLIVYLGVKMARNQAMPEVFQETINHRIYEGKPVWVIDQPGNPYNVNHLCYSPDGMAILHRWDRVQIPSIFGSTFETKKSGTFEVEEYLSDLFETPDAPVPSTTPHEVRQPVVNAPVVVTPEVVRSPVRYSPGPTNHQASTTGPSLMDSILNGNKPPKKRWK